MDGVPTQLEEADNPGVAVKFNIAIWDASDFSPLTSKSAVTTGLEFLRRCGYNAIRLFNPEIFIMARNPGEFAWDAERLDLFYWMMSECKRLGIYYEITPAGYILYLDNGGESRFTYDERDNCKPRMFTEQGIRDHWKEGFRQLYIVPNPYTGIGAALDPACVQVELFNESGVCFCASVAWPTVWLTRNTGAVAAADTWPEWIANASRSGYADIAALNGAWGTAYGAFADVPTPHILVSADYPTTRAGVDAVLYAQYLEDDLNTFYAECIAEWGIQSLTTMHHLYPQVWQARAAGKLSTNKLANSHGYAMLVGNLTPGLSFTGGKTNTPVWDSSTWNWLFAHPFVCSGKPRWYGEYGWSVWGRYRANFVMQMAMAAMHGASAVANHSQGNFWAPSYYNDTSLLPGDRLRRLYPYANNSDPVEDFVRALTTLIFSGGVAEHTVSQSLVLNDRYFGTSPITASRIGRSLSYLFQPLYFLSGFVKPSLDWTSDTTDDTLAATWNVRSLKQLLDEMVSAGSITTGNASYISVTANYGSIIGVDRTVPAVPVFEVASHTLVTGDFVFITTLTGSGAGWPSAADIRNVPREVTVVDSTHWSVALDTSGYVGSFVAGTWCESLNVFESATGEFGMSRRDSNCWIDSGKISYLSHIGSTLPRTLGSVVVTALDDHASVFVAALDGVAISASSRLLIGLCADAQNTGMTFTDATRTTLVAGGDYPVQITDATAKLTLALTSAKDWKLYRLQRDGTRNSRESPISRNAATGELLLTLRSGSIYPSVLWELVR